MTHASDGSNLLVDNTLNSIHAHLEHVHSRTIRQTHKVVARAVKQVTAARGVQVEEDTRNHNHLLLQTGLEEVEAVRNRLGETLQVKPANRHLVPLEQPQPRQDNLQVKGRVRHVLDDEAHLAEASHNVVTLVLDNS